MTTRRPLACLAALLLSASVAAADDPRLVPAYRVPMSCNGVATSDADGRAFVSFSHPEGGQGVKVGAVQPDGSVAAYPDLTWNRFKVGDDPRHTFVSANALRFGPDGLLYVVDTGTQGTGTKPVPGGPKIVVIDTAANRVVRTIPMDGVCHPDSFIDDVRFHGPRAYVTDAGSPGLIVLDLASGTGRRVLDGDPSTTAQRPAYAQGKVLLKMDGTPFQFHADQLEVSPDGRWFYYQPACGRLSRIETRYLDDPATTDLPEHVGRFYDTPTTGGTCIDAAGNIYVSDVDHQRVIRLTPDAKASVVIQDPRLIWGDAMWIDKGGDLLIPAAQLNHTAPFAGGIPSVTYPVIVYRLPLGLRPIRN